jgi:hypothetical protein
MVAFILVHGTFVSEADWPLLRASLSQVADQQFDAPKFEQVPWTGKNRLSARESAARSIAVKVRSLRADEANERIFIIGHSHGGSSICYFLKHFREEATAISGCAFLSTPFIAIRNRQYGVDLAEAAALFPAAIAALALFVVYLLLNRLSEDVAFAYFGVMFLLSVIAITFAVIFVKSDRFRDVMKERTRILVERQTADLPNGNYLFLRCSGDEAAAALSAVQFSAWLSDRIYSTLRGIKIRRSVLIVLYVASLGSLIARALFHAYAPSVLPYFEYLSLVTNPDSVGLTVLIVLLASLILNLILVSATSWVFGWTGLFAGPLVQLAIEPIPYGAHSLIHIPWTGCSHPLESLVHSWTYAHPVALEHLRSWVQSGLGKQPYKDSNGRNLELREL